MKKYKVSFHDVFHGESEEDVIQQLVTYLLDCARLEDVTAFDIQEEKS